jgi:hypothetical protein
MMLAIALASRRSFSWGVCSHAASVVLAFDGGGRDARRRGGFELQQKETGHADRL